MPKHLFLCRHAHTQEPAPGQRDFDRALTAAGRQEAALTGAFIASFGLKPDAFFCSAALRTFQTAEEIAQILSFKLSELKSSQDLYNIQSQSLLHRISNFEDNWQTVIIVGHNPAISEVASRLGNGRIYVPTGGCNYFTSKATEWPMFDVMPLQLKTNF